MSRNSCKGVRALGLLAVCVLSLHAAAGARIERQFPLAPGGRLVLDTDAGGVEVTAASASEARVVITSPAEEIEAHYELGFELAENALLIKVVRKEPERSWLFRRGIGLHFAVTVPAPTSLDIDTSGGGIKVSGTRGEARLDTSGGAIEVRDLGGNLSADTSGGSIEIQGVVGDVAADTSGGGIRIEDVSGSVRADTSGGSIRIHGARGDVNADTSGGSIHVGAAGGRVEAETSGGGIEVAFEPGNARGGTLSTSGGGIVVTLDPSVGLEIDASTSGGSVTSDLPITLRGEADKHSLRGSLGGGGERLVLRASGGPIRIQAP